MFLQCDVTVAENGKLHLWKKLQTSGFVDFFRGIFYTWRRGIITKGRIKREINSNGSRGLAYEQDALPGSIEIGGRTPGVAG